MGNPAPTSSSARPKWSEGVAQLWESKSWLRSNKKTNLGFLESWMALRYIPWNSGIMEYGGCMVCETHFGMGNDGLEHWGVLSLILMPVPSTYVFDKNSDLNWSPTCPWKISTVFFYVQTFVAESHRFWDTWIGRSKVFEPPSTQEHIVDVWMFQIFWSTSVNKNPIWNLANIHFFKHPKPVETLEQCDVWLEVGIFRINGDKITRLLYPNLFLVYFRARDTWLT